jgi:flagellar capping protein FliD
MNGLADLRSHFDSKIDALRSEHGRQLEEIRAEQKRLADTQARTEGQLSVMLQWLQSMDQRFGALMAPINPPPAPDRRRA